ncbi:MAG: murein hydrolase activator EnvC family protein [Miltoncostaeaceae bacterium]
MRRFLLLLSLSGVIVALCVAIAAGQGIDDQRREVERLEAQLAALDAEAGAAAAAHNNALVRLDGLRQRIATTRREIAASERARSLAQRALEERLVAVYVREEPTLLDLLISAGSVSDALSARELLERVAATDAGIVRNVRERRQRLDDLKQELDSAERRTENEAAERRRQRDELTAIAGRRREVLDGARAELRELLAEERRRKQALARLRQAESAGSFEQTERAPAGAPSTGQIFPVAGANRFSDDWLAPRGGGRLHQGIDIFAPQGTPLVAVADGTLFRVGYNGLGGWRLWLRDGSGTTYYYAHLSSFSGAAREGASVAGGTVLGFVGTSGDARGTSPHLHFEIHPGGGGPVRPFPIIVGWPRAG